jgi:hypothetical protein
MTFRTEFYLTVTVSHRTYHVNAEGILITNDEDAQYYTDIEEAEEDADAMARHSYSVEINTCQRAR